MNSLFNMDGPVMSFLNRVADLIWLNILALVCCIPIVTAGASLTALHYMTIKMIRKEDGYITRGFFKSFRQTFKQATLLWMLMLLAGGIIWVDLFLLNRVIVGLPKAFSVVISAVGILVVFTFIYIFPVLARFDNTIKNTIKNAFLMSILNFPKTILMVIIYAIPGVVMFLIPAVFPLVFMMGLSLPAYVASIFFVGIFKRFEPEEAEGLINEGEE